jgi:outer membrane lipoprotein carrier protein LolA
MLLSALLLTAATSAPGQAQERGRGIEALEQRLARTPPVSTAFVEYRFSHLLKKPLRSSGTLDYRADGVMVRNVVTPSRETSEVDGDQVRVTRAGKPTRSMSLQRAPQLRVLLGSFRALLQGKLTPLRQDFEVTLVEDATRWTLTLKPKDPTLAKHLAHIDVHGLGDKPACLEALEPDGDGALTLFTAAPAGNTLPTRAELERTCRGPAAQGAAPP